MKRIVIHRGPLPGTVTGHRWFTGGDGKRYTIQGGPGPGNDGWAYEICDEGGTIVDDSYFTLDDIRKWAAALEPDDEEARPFAEALARQWEEAQGQDDPFMALARAVMPLVDEKVRAERDTAACSTGRPSPGSSPVPRRPRTRRPRSGQH